jgi:hypothetical protein
MMMRTKMMMAIAVRVGLLVAKEGPVLHLSYICAQYSFYLSGISIENPDRQRGVPGGDMVRELLRRAAE